MGEYARIRNKPTDYKLTDDQRERLTKSELAAMQWLLHALSSLRYVQTDLARRIAWIPFGKRDLALAIWHLDRICRDLIETIPTEQVKRIGNQMKDNEIRIVPKLTPAEYRMTMTKDEAMECIDLMRVACKECVKDGEECRSCQRYKMLTALTPLESYDGFYGCPYGLAEWEDR
jgi:hypothetical protein